MEKREESRGTCERTGWATRLRKSGKNGGKSRGMCERTGWATRLRKSGRKEKSQGGCVSVLGGLLG